MTHYLLDTNIISTIIKPQPSETLLAWMAAQRDDDLFVASMTIAEIQRGIRLKLPGKKRDAFAAWFAGAEGHRALFAGRILRLDDTAGLGTPHDGRQNCRAASRCRRHDHRSGG